MIYEPFSQEEQGYTRSYDGNGIGVTLVKKYCELNKIELQVSSKITLEHALSSYSIEIKIRAIL